MQFMYGSLIVYLVTSAAAAKQIKIPSPITDTGVKVIPDVDHPFRAPRPGDQRGPCPGLNTLANHGYLPRNGIASVAEITNAVQEGFNMEYHLGLALAAFGMLVRGNVLEDKLSIGGPSPHVKPLPNNIDGIPGGLATHGRFEGDMSLFRDDLGLGDNVHFQQHLFDQLLEIVAQRGDRNGTIINTDSFAEFKFQRYLDSRDRNPTFEFHEFRRGTSFAEVAFTLGFFPNSTEAVLTIPVATSIFANQRFPDNWHRRGTPLGVAELGPLIAPVIAPHGAEMLIGENKDGVFVPDTPSSDPCTVFLALRASIPDSLLGPNATKAVKRNTEVLLDVFNGLLGSGCSA